MTEVSKPPEYASTIFMIGPAVLAIDRSGQSKNRVFNPALPSGIAFRCNAGDPSFAMNAPTRSAADRAPAFTLVEIMVVIVIIGLLAALAIPAVRRSQRASQNTRVINDFRVFVQA